MSVKVTLLTHTPNPEQVVAMAAKLCYSPSGIEDLRDGLTEEKTTSFLNMLSDLAVQQNMYHLLSVLRVSQEPVLISWYDIESLHTVSSPKDMLTVLLLNL